MTVYVDVVVSFNFIINYLILKSVKFTASAKEKEFGITAAAMFGGIYSVFMFDDRFRIIYSFPLKLIVSAIMICIAFKASENFIKLTAYFYISAFLFSGAAEFAENLTGVITMRNGMFYVENSIWVVLSGCIISFCFITYLLKHISMKKKFKTEKTGITVFIDGKSVDINGLVDTGNSLLDPITLYPVVVVEYDQIKPILSDEMKEFLKQGTNLKCSLNRKYLNKIRLIPYNTISGNEILKGFKPDYIKINGQEDSIRDVIIAVVYNKLSVNNDFNAILNPLI